MREFDKYGYRVMINDNHNFFIRDQLSIVILESVPEGYKPIVVEIRHEETIPRNAIEGTNYQLHDNIIPRELAEVLLSAFASYFMGGDDNNLVNENRRLSAELKQERVRLNKLIDGIANLSEKKK